MTNQRFGLPGCLLAVAVIFILFIEPDISRALPGGARLVTPSRLRMMKPGEFETTDDVQLLKALEVLSTAPNASLR